MTEFSEPPQNPQPPSSPGLPSEFDPLPGRADPPYVADELTMLRSWLDFHRATLLSKCEGLEAAQLRSRAVPPSNLSLLGLVRHLTEVERSWFRRRLTGAEIAPLYYSDLTPDGDFDDVDGADPEADFVAYRLEVDTCRAIAGQYQDPSVLSAVQRNGQDLSLRWIYLHMIEEYARHNGHADLLRESIDGRTGD